MSGRLPSPDRVPLTRRLQPDELVAELNGDADHEWLTALVKRYRALKR
ncbi:hypothetical protein GCM10009682_63780 [Luedemannella flava]|uniref:Uncharacterized protein n=1 Tax=Luedemannella flava TaxID=349316 RepID=A0ABP4Z2V1_9ACTN